MVNSPRLPGTDVCSEETGVGIVMKAMSVDDRIIEI